MKVKQLKEDDVKQKKVNSAVLDDTPNLEQEPNVAVSAEVKHSMDAFGFSDKVAAEAKNLAALNRRANNDLEKALTDMYMANREEYILAKNATDPNTTDLTLEQKIGAWNEYQPMNLLITGEPGGGKTSIIRQWAARNDIALVTVTGSALQREMVQGFPVTVPKEGNPDVKELTFIPSTAFKGLNDKAGRFTVLFIDEINRADPASEAALLTLIQSHTLQNLTIDSGEEHFDKFLFTIAAQNPPDTNEEIEKLGGALGNAMVSRFKGFWWVNDPKKTAEFWCSTLEGRKRGVQRMANNGSMDSKDAQVLINKCDNRMKIWQALASSTNPKFEFDDETENPGLKNSNVAKPVNRKFDIALNARTLASLINYCDGTVGTVIAKKGNIKYYSENSFLENFQEFCGSNATTFAKVEKILHADTNVTKNANANDFEGDSWMTLYMKINHQY